MQRGGGPEVTVEVAERKQVQGDWRSLWRTLRAAGKRGEKGRERCKALTLR